MGLFKLSLKFLFSAKKKKKKEFYFFLAISMPFSPWLYSTIRLNRSDEDTIPCLAAEVGEKKVTVMLDVRCEFFGSTLYQIKKIFISVLLRRDIKFYQIIFASIERIIWIYFSILLI